MTSYINSSGLPDEEIEKQMPGILREVARWTQGLVHANNPDRPSIFDRRAYVAPDSPYSQFKVARTAVANDDIVSGVCEVTAGLTFQGIKWEGEESDEVDVFNQMSGDLDLDNFVRMWYRENYTYSQAVIGMWWGRKEYTVRGYNVTPPEPEQTTDEMGQTVFKPTMDPKTGKPMKPKKVRKKRKFEVQVPVGLTFLDPMKVIPISPTVFGRDRLVWQSTASEINRLERVKNGEVFDEVMEKFFLERYVPNRDEAEELTKMGVVPDYLIELNPDYVFRIAPTRKPYERFADLRLRSVFSLLDLKQQLIEADRVALVGQANYILLIRKGDKDQPASSEELSNLREGVRSLAKVPVLIGDHRLQIDIITPDQQYSLSEERYEVLDKRILNRCLGANTVDNGEGSVTSKTIARSLENQRHALKRELEKHIAAAVIEKNPGVFKDTPNLTFTPKNIQMDSDASVTNAVMALRTAKELSRETVLEWFGFDQSVEAQRREYEEESGLDEIFGTVVPFSSPDQGGTPQQNGQQGGRPQGGGRTAQSPQKQVAPKTKTGNPSTKK